MVYQSMNMVFLGISIEGIACCRPIEVLEKRGLPSQVKWAGGAAAGAINPAPLFGPQFYTLQNLGGVRARPFQALGIYQRQKQWIF